MTSPSFDEDEDEEEPLLLEDLGFNLDCATFEKYYF